MGWGSKIQNLHSELWPWFDPGSRLYYLNLLSALVLSVIFLSWVRFKNNKNKSDSIFSLQALKSHFKNYWLHPSAQVDYQIYALNAFLKVFLFAPVLGLSLYISMYTIKGLYLLSPDFKPLEGSALLFFAATVFAFLWDDFLRFYHHYLMHKVGWMWQLHKTHHSAEVLTPITLFRTHPLESLQGTLRNALSFGVSGGIFMFLFSGQVELTTLLGVNIFGFLFNSLTGNLRHSQIPISFGWFENIFISPKQHQIHHSNQPLHFNKNFGVALSCWDKMFGSYLRSDHQQIHGYGVKGTRSDSLLEQLWPWSTDFDLQKSRWATHSLKFIQSLRFESLRKLTHRKTLITMSVLFLLLSPSFVFASYCLDYLESYPSVRHLSRQNHISRINAMLSGPDFFVEDRLVTVSGPNVTLNLRSQIPGMFRATLVQPFRVRGQTIPALFAKPSLERKFMSLRHPFDSELYEYWLSGHLKWVDVLEREPRLVLIIEKMWKKNQNLKLHDTSENVIELAYKN